MTVKPTSQPGIIHTSAMFAEMYLTYLSAIGKSYIKIDEFLYKFNMNHQ
jgi:hypothetical protein